MTPDPEALAQEAAAHRLQTLLEAKAAQWDAAAPFIEQALQYNTSHTLADVHSCYLRGTVQLWVGERCAAVTEFQGCPRKWTLNVWLAGGDMAEMQTLRPGMEAWARGQGCTAICFMGRMTRQSKHRLGWRKASGYEPQWVNLTKEL